MNTNNDSFKYYPVNSNKKTLNFDPATGLPEDDNYDVLDEF